MRRFFLASRAVATGAVAFALALSGCMRVCLDLRPIESPVVLNRNPFVGGAPAGAAALPVGTYDTRLGQGWFFVAVPRGGSSSGYNAKDKAQLDAFMEVGGHTNRAITGVALGARRFAIWGLFFASQSVTLDATGQTQEYKGGSK